MKVGQTSLEREQAKGEEQFHGTIYLAFDENKYLHQHIEPHHITSCGCKTSDIASYRRCEHSLLLALGDLHRNLPATNHLPAQFLDRAINLACRNTNEGVALLDDDL